MKTRQDPDWAAEVKQGLSWLFAKQDARLVDSTYRRGSFGSKTAVIHVGNIILRVSRDVTLPPEYIEARIAPRHAPTDFKSPLAGWTALSLIADGTIPPTPPYKDFGTLQGLSNLLQRHFTQLNDAYSAANYRLIRLKIGEVEDAHWREWKQEHSRK